LDEIRTLFLVNDKPEEIIWTREYGKWKVKHAAAKTLMNAELLFSQDL
jgi:hypothetical protein